MPALQRVSIPEFKGLYANSNRLTQPKGTVPRISNLYMVRRGGFHTVPGSKWISSYDGLAPHSTSQAPLKHLLWYSPSQGSAAANYMNAYPAAATNDYIIALQLATPSTAGLINVSALTFGVLAAAVPVTQPTTAHGYQLNSVQFSDFVITALGCGTPPQMFPMVALTSIDVGTTDTTANVYSTIGFPSSGYILIDSEAIHYGSTSPTSFNNLSRGQLGTAAATHFAPNVVTYGTNVSGIFAGQVWSPIQNSFNATTIYGPWPGVPNSATGPSVAVQIGTLIIAYDGNNIPWPFRAQNSGFTGFGTGYWGPPFWPGGVNGGGNMTSGSGVLTAVSSAPFLSSQVGMPCTVYGAAAGGGPLVTSVASFTDAAHVTLALPAGSNVTNASFSIGSGHYGDQAREGGTGTEIWANIGQAALSPPGAAYVFQHEGYLFLWGVGAAYGQNGITGPDALWQSNFGRPTEFDPANVTFVGKGDGTEAQGGAVFSLSEAGIAATPQLVLFKDNTTYSFLDVFPNATLVQVSGGMGCVAPGTIQYVGGLGVMRLSYAGFTLFDGQLEHVSEYTDPIEEYLFGGLADVNPVDFANVANGVSTQATKPQMYIAFLPILGGTGYATRGFIYDFSLKQWTIMDLPFAVGAATYEPQSVVSGHLGLRSLIGGSGDGAVRRIFAADPDWDGTAITWSFRTPELGNPGTPIYLRRANLRIVLDSGSPSLTSVGITGILRSGATLSASLNVPNLFGTIDIGRIVISAHLDVVGSGQIFMEGVDFHMSDKPMSLVGL